MKTNQKALLLASIITGALLTSNAALADVKNSKHNLSATAGTGQVNSWSGTTEICVFCHTPHSQETIDANNTMPPLWNKTVLVPPTYNTYNTLGTASLDGKTAPVGSVSVACLSCHDGTQAMDVMINEPGSGLDTITNGSETWTGTAEATGEMGVGTLANLGTDLRNDHPVGIQYGGGPGSEANGYNDADFTEADVQNINGKNTWWVDSEASPNGTRQKTDIQLYARQPSQVVDITGALVASGISALEPFVECASCHDPHSTEATFLRTSNDGSAVCLACHVK